MSADAFAAICNAAEGIAKTRLALAAQEDRLAGMIQDLATRIRAGETTGHRGTDLSIVSHRTISPEIIAAYEAIDAALAGKTGQAVLVRCTETRLTIHRLVGKHEYEDYPCFRLGFLTNDHMVMPGTEPGGPGIVPIEKYVAGDAHSRCRLVRVDGNILGPSIRGGNPCTGWPHAWNSIVTIGDEPVREWLAENARSSVFAEAAALLDYLVLSA